MVRCQCHRAWRRKIPRRIARNDSWLFRVTDLIVGDGEALHRMPDQVHLSGEVSTRFAYEQVQAYADAFDQR